MFPKCLSAMQIAPAHRRIVRSANFGKTDPARLFLPAGLSPEKQTRAPLGGRTFGRYQLALTLNDDSGGFLVSLPLPDITFGLQPIVQFVSRLLSSLQEKLVGPLLDRLFCASRGFAALTLFVGVL